MVLKLTRQNPWNAAVAFVAWLCFDAAKPLDSMVSELRAVL